MEKNLLSLGHSSLSLERFLELLNLHKVTAVADVRTSPYSKQSPWFNQAELRSSLKKSGISYSFLGVELGGRPKSPELYMNGIADYEAMAATAEFASGITRLISGLEEYCICLVCSEKDPLHCHRCLLVGRQLSKRGLSISHIHHHGGTETHPEAEERLLSEESLSGDDLYHPRSERLVEAYLRRNLSVAYSLNPSKPERVWKR